MLIFVATSLCHRVCKSVSGPIFGLYSEQLSFAFRGIGFLRSQTRRSSTTSTIAEATIDITRSIFARSRQRSTTYWLKRSSNVAFFPCGKKNVEVRDYRKEDLFAMFCFFAPVTRHSVQTMCTMFSRKDFFRLFEGLLIISTRKTNPEPRCLTALGGHDGAICAAKHLELVHAHHLPLYGFD